MTPDEAAKVAAAVATADGGCHVCVANVAQELASSLPDVPWPQLVAQAFYPDADYEDNRAEMVATIEAGTR